MSSALRRGFPVFLSGAALLECVARVLARQPNIFLATNKLEKVWAEENEDKARLELEKANEILAKKDMKVNHEREKRKHEREKRKHEREKREEMKEKGR